MTSDSIKQAQAFKAEVEAKIQTLISEFAEGKVSREQFNVLYERYSARLSIANHAILSGNPDAVAIAQTGPPTIAVREQHMGKVIGLLIYHNVSETVLETLGDFQVEMNIITPVLEDFTMQALARQYIERRVQQMNDERWLCFVPGRFTTIVALFRHEPSGMQTRELERLQHDFEQANLQELDGDSADPSKLGYPFLGFVKRKYRRDNDEGSGR